VCSSDLGDLVRSGSVLFREELEVPRIRFWVVVALFAGGLFVAAQSSAQEKGKAPETPADKPQDKAPAAPAAPAAQEAGKVDIHWKLQKDQKVYQEMATKTSQAMKVMGMDVNQTQEQTFYFSWEVKDEDKDKNTTLLQRIEGVNLKIDIAGNPITYNSANPSSANNSLAEFFKQLVGTEFKLTLDKDMKVVKVEGRDDFLKKLGQANQTMEPLLKKVLNEEALKQMADPSFGMLPGKPVGKGETWTRDSRLSLGPIGSYKNSYKYTLDKVEGDKATIKVECNLTYEPPTEAGDGLPFKIKSAKLTSKESGGSIVFDIAKGRLDKQELKIKLEGELEIEISGTTTKVELKQDQTTTITTSDQPQNKKP